MESIFNMSINDKALLFFFRIRDYYFKHKTVDLRLRKRICTLLFYWVLSSQYEEWVRQSKSFFTYSYLMLLHSFEKCGLNLCRSTIYLIGENEVGENRTFFYNKVLVFLTINHSTDYVGRQQIRGKLNTAKVGINKLCQSFYCKGFGQSRYTF